MVDINMFIINVRCVIASFTSPLPSFSIFLLLVSISTFVTQPLIIIIVIIITVIY